jgi:hypothetical protein
MPRKTYKVATPTDPIDPSKVNKSDKSWGGKRILDGDDPSSNRRKRVDSSVPSQGSDWKSIVSLIEYQGGVETIATYCDGREIARYKPSFASRRTEK